MSTERRGSPGRAVDITEVARKANVSPATVSRVLNDSPNVGETYRESVMAAVADLGYRPNRLARNLRRQQADMIGVVVSDIENPHFTEMVRAVEDQAYGQGYRVLLCNTDEDPEKQSFYLSALAQERVLGVILSPTDANGAEIGQLLDLDIPIVGFDRMLADARADAVTADNVGAAEIATRHLAEGGHRGIALVNGPSEIETSEERRTGYERAMHAAGLPLQEVAADFRIEGGRRATLELMELPDPPTALVVTNNLMTIGAMRALRSAGVGVPDDVALVAIDDPFWSELTDPPLTTLAQPVRRMAEGSMSLLTERMGGGRSQSKRLSFPMELRVRVSCGRGDMEG